MTRTKSASVQEFIRGEETWQIARDGTSLKITTTTAVVANKKAAKKTATVTRKFVGEEQAKTQYAKLVAAQVAAGFVENAQPRTLADEVMAPDDLEALEVHADSLMERGHFLGEVIAAQLALHKLSSISPVDDPQIDEKRTHLATEARKLLVTNHEELFGAFALHALSVVPKKGTHESESTGQYAACTASWRVGIIDEVALTASSKMALSLTIPALAKLPFAQFLRSIVVGASVPPSSRLAPSSYDRLVIALCEHASAFPRLRSLFLGNLGEDRVATATGPLEPLFAAYPNLETIRIRANLAKITVGSIKNLKKLRAIELGGNCANLDALRAIRDAGLDDTIEEVLTDTMRGSREEIGLAIECVRDLPKLERLGLRGWRGENKIASLIADRRLLPRLKELDLSYCELFTETAALLEHADRFAHLEKLDLRFNNFGASRDLGANRLRELREALPRANFAGQTVVPRADRYEGIRE